MNNQNDKNDISPDSTPPVPAATARPAETDSGIRIDAFPMRGRIAGGSRFRKAETETGAVYVGRFTFRAWKKLRRKGRKDQNPVQILFEIINSAAAL
jgi:hypothetical protein